MSEPHHPEDLRAQLALRASRWRRFREWELGEIAASRSDFASALTWMSEAWQLASREDPSWASPDGWEEHVRHLVRVRTRLAALDRA